MSCLMIEIVAVVLVLDLGAVVSACSSHRSNNAMKPATEEALKKLWRGFRAVDYVVVSAYMTIRVSTLYRYYLESASGVDL